LTWQHSELLTAMVRKIGGTQYLWTCHQIGVNSAGNNDSPPTGTGPADRSGIEWFKIQTSPSVSITENNRIYDIAATNPKFYYVPSLAVNNNGDMVVGFSGSSANDYIGAYYSGRRNDGSIPSTPIRYYAGQGPITFPQDLRWGDYSNTSLDPDGLSIWTIQEYAEPNNHWGTRFAAITPY